MTDADVEKEIEQRSLRVVDFQSEQPSMALSRPGEGGLKDGNYIFEEGESLYNEDVIINGDQIYKDNGDPVITMVSFISQAEKKGKKWVAVPDTKKKCYLSFLRKRFEVANAEGKATNDYKESRGQVVDDVFNAQSWQDAWENVLLGKAFSVKGESFKGFRYGEDSPKTCRVFECEWLPVDKHW